MQTPSLPIDRRSTPRKSARKSIQLHCRRGCLGFGADLAAGFVDISQAGAGILANEMLAEGDEVEIVLEGHGLRSPIRRIADVRWASATDEGRFHAGVRFHKHITYHDVQMVSR
jgi:hypothetical protein